MAVITKKDGTDVYVPNGIMSSIAEFYSLNLATEVKKGLNEKVKKGGTVSKAPLGYLNVHKVDEMGREYRTVELDTKRASLITMTFNKYATGDYYMDDLAEELAAMGLTTRATPNIPAQAITGKRLNQMLANPYYKGIVVYCGAKYTGSHPPIIDSATWQAVQDIRDLHRNGERTRDHDHFLKSSIYCGTCGSRLLVHMAKNKHGNIYPYFICIGRHNKTTGCTQKALSIYEVETKIEQLYERISLPETVRKQYEEFLLKTIAEIEKESETERAALLREKNKIEHQQKKLLEAHFADAIPLKLLKEKQDALSKELDVIECQLTAFETNSKVVSDNLRSAFDVINDCGKYYKSAPDNIKRAFNQALFDKLLIMPDGTPIPKYSEPYNLLLKPLLTTTHGAETAEAQPDSEMEENTLHSAIETMGAPRLLDRLQEKLKHPSNFFGECLSTDFLVE
jgi:hypothetical protein